MDLLLASFNNIDDISSSTIHKLLNDSQCSCHQYNI